MRLRTVSLPTVRPPGLFELNDLKTPRGGIDRAPNMAAPTFVRLLRRHRLPRAQGQKLGSKDLGSMTVSSASSSAAWPSLRSLYPIYSALARESVIETQPCRELEE